MVLGSRNLHVVCRRCGLIADRKRKSDDFRSTSVLLVSLRCGNCYAQARDGDVMFSLDGGQTFFHEIASVIPPPQWEPGSVPPARPAWATAPSWQDLPQPSRGSRAAADPSTPAAAPIALLVASSAAAVSIMLFILLMPAFRFVGEQFSELVDRALSPVAFVSSENLEERRSAAPVAYAPSAHTEEGDVAALWEYCKSMEARVDFSGTIRTEEARALRMQYYDRCSKLAAKP